MTLGPIMADVQGHELAPEEKELLQHPLIGAVILFSRNYAGREQVSRLIQDIRAVRDPPLLIAVDQEGGRVQRFKEEFTALPPLRWLGHEYDIDPRRARQLSTLCGWLMATEVRSVGADFSFAPVLDIDRGLSEIIGDRAFHSDSEIVATLSRSYCQGMRNAGMAAVAKHFPGHGGVVADSHLALPEDHRSYEELLDDIYPYRTLISNGLQGVMPAHVRYTKVDERIASMSEFWLQTELRQNLDFKGAIFSDDLSMEGASIEGDIPTRVEKTLAAGADMALICNNPAAVAATIDHMNTYLGAASYARLAAMRPLQPQADEAYGSSHWQETIDTLRAALERPSLTLDG
ncbi:MAG: beta-N-acetylhexosaminidase [Gammaproteobacteria bacterium]